MGWLDSMRARPKRCYCSLSKRDLRVSGERRIDRARRNRRSDVLNVIIGAGFGLAMFVAGMATMRSCEREEQQVVEPETWVSRR
jgi:hypothetical protein